MEAELDSVLADRVADLADRLWRGETVDFNDLAAEDPACAEELRRLLPTIRMMTGLSEPLHDFPQPVSLNDFKVIREVARGGMGVIYEAEQVSLRRRVALKVLPNAAVLDARHLRRFQVEAQAAASLQHPNIVQVYANGTDGGLPYYAMPFIEGRDLAKVILRLRQNAQFDATEVDPLSASLTPLTSHDRAFAVAVARLARQAAEALDHAHRREVLHRDIKPSNLLIDLKGHLWITDFGLARIRDDLELTQTGDALGTPRYMSPEQASARRTGLDGRTDVYSLGATFYELLTLRPAFEGNDRVELLRQIAVEEPTPPRKINPAIPVDLETIILKAMSKSPADRYATSLDLAEDLRRFIEDRPILAKRPSIPARMMKWSRRHRQVVAAATVFATFVAVALPVAAWCYAALLQRHNEELQDQIARANLSAQEAKEQRWLARRHFHAAQLRLAQQAIDSRHFEVAQNMLDAAMPSQDRYEATEFAWNYLHHQSRRELIRLPELDAQVWRLSPSADGNVLAAGYRDGRVVLWDLRKEELISTIGDGNLSDPCLSPDGLHLATKHGAGGWDLPTEIALWSTTSRQLLARWPLDALSKKIETSEEFIAGGRRLASRWEDGKGYVSLRIWDVQNPGAAPSVVLDGLDDVAFAQGRDVDVFVSVEQGRFLLRDVATGAVRREVSEAIAGCRTPRLSADGRRLAVSRDKRLVLLIDTTDGSEIDRFDPETTIIPLSLSGGGQQIAALDEEGRVHMWDREAGKAHVIRTDDIEGSHAPMHPIFSPDGRYLLTTPHVKPGGAQPRQVWEVATGRCVGTLPGPDQKTLSAFFTPDSRAVILDGGRSPRIWHFLPAEEPSGPNGHDDEAWSAAFSPDGKLLATGSDDTVEIPRLPLDTIRIWDPATGRLVRGWYAGVGTVSSLAFSPDGTVLYSSQLTDRENLLAWDVATGRLLRVLTGHTDHVRAISVSPDGKRLVSTCRAKTIRVWDLDAGTSLFAHPDHADLVRGIAFSPDGKTFASACMDETLARWDARTGNRIDTVRRSANLTSVAFAPNGRTLATSDDTGNITLDAIPSLDRVRTIRGESDDLQALAFAPDGRSLASAGISGIIRLWDAETGQQLLTLNGPPTQINGLAFSPDGSLLVSCAHDGTVKIWRSQCRPQ